MVSAIQRFYHTIVTVRSESFKVVEFIERRCGEPKKEYKVLDAGCGAGRYLQLLSQSGFDVTGVDENPELVRTSRKSGFHCLTTEEFSRTQDEYDIILMSHVIEHFTPQDLLPFMDGYLDRLKVGGSLIIATPLLTRYFYDDFDHVKPYHARAIMMVFGTDNAQVQYYSRNKLILEDLWIRRSPLSLPHMRGRYVSGPQAKPHQAMMFLSAVLFRLSGGFIGESSGWVGRFKKVG